MTIQEAMRGGKPFKRPKMEAWIGCHGGIYTMLSHAFSYLSSDQKVRLTVEDILANDWEEKP